MGMIYALVGILIIFLIYLYIETRYKSQRIISAVSLEKRSIAEDSGMTASIGVFAPDIQTTVVIGASEETGAFYYRMLRKAKVVIRSKINLANISKVEFLVNSILQQVNLESNQPTLSLRATEIADDTIAQFSHDSIRQIGRTAMRIVFFDETSQEKALEITTFRSGDERQKFERVRLLKNTVWWVAFLQLASRQARHTRASLEAKAE